MCLHHLWWMDGWIYFLTFILLYFLSLFGSSNFLYLLVSSWWLSEAYYYIDSLVFNLHLLVLPVLQNTLIELRFPSTMYFETFCVVVFVCVSMMSSLRAGMTSCCPVSCLCHRMMCFWSPKYSLWPWWAHCSCKFIIHVFYKCQEESS